YSSELQKTLFPPKKAVLGKKSTVIYISMAEGTLFSSAKGRKVVVVHTMKQALQRFKQVHASPQGEHQGKVKMRIALTSKYYWPGMTKDITGWRIYHSSQFSIIRKFAESAIHTILQIIYEDTTLKNIK
ncbi:unnamed protein product, partial [Caretta caretta]